VALYCAKPRIEAAIADGPLELPCRCGERVYYPGWWCDDCAHCAFPELVRQADDEPEDYA
jgi:hypothetical protein